MMTSKIFIAGSGGIGQAVGLILADLNIFHADIFYGDVSQAALDSAKDFVQNGTSHNVKVETILMDKGGNYDNLDAILGDCDVLLDCLPGSLAPKMARLARKKQLSLCQSYGICF